MAERGGGRAVIYARFSSHNQREASIEDQVRACREEAERRGDEVVEVYADRARTGTTTAGRDEFLRMMDDARSHGWETVYVYKLDRFARDRYDSAINRKRLRDLGVTLRPVAETVPDGPEGIMLEAMLEGMAEYYSANLSQNVRRGMDGNARKCMHNGARLYGYDLGDDGYYHVNEDEARVVRRVFDMYDGGATAPQIVRELEPYRTRKGKRFRTSHVMRMLRNEKYAGTYVYKDVRVPGGMEAIVGMEQFERVAAELGERASRRPRRHGTAPYILTGRLFDEEGRPYVGVSGTARDGSKRCYYKCLKTGVSWRKEDVEDAMMWAVATMLQADRGTCEEIARLVSDEEDRAREGDRAREDAIRSRLAQIETATANLMRAMEEGAPARPLAARMAELEEERAALEAEAEELGSGMGDMYAMALFVLERLREAAASPAVAVPFVSRMEVSAAGDVHVEFSIDGRTPVDEAGVLIGRKWLGH